MPASKEFSKEDTADAKSSSALLTAKSAFANSATAAS
jgi:hypothetical protein